MIDYVYGHDEAVARFVAAMIPSMGGRSFGNCTALGVIEDGHLIAGLVYHNWDPLSGTIEMSGAALPGHLWLSRETVRRMYRYPFRDCQCQMVIMRVDEDDQRLLRQLAALNYSFIRIPRLLGRAHDAILCLLTDEAWAENKFCKRYHHHLDPEHREAA